MLEFPEERLNPDVDSKPSICFFIKTRDTKGYYKTFSFTDPDLMLYFAKLAASHLLTITDTKIHFYNIYMIGLPERNNKLERLTQSNMGMTVRTSRNLKSINSSKDIDKIFEKIRIENKRNNN